MQYLTTATDSALPVAVILYGNRDFGNKGLPYDWRGNHSTPLIAEQLDKTYLSDMSWGHFPWSESEVQAEIMSAVLRQMGVSHEIILVNDGSTDTTPEIIRELSEIDPNLVGVFLARNRGQCTAIYAGIQHSCGRYVVIMANRKQALADFFSRNIGVAKSFYSPGAGDGRNLLLSCLDGRNLRRGLTDGVQRGFVGSVEDAPQRVLGDGQLAAGGVAVAAVAFHRLHGRVIANFLHRHGAGRGRTQMLAGAHVRRQVLHLDEPARAEDAGEFEDVLQLADVAGEGVGHGGAGDGHRQLLGRGSR